MEKFEKAFRKVITEEKEVEYDYGCIMLELDLDEKWWDSILEKVSKDDIYTGSEEDKDKYGLEDEPHITLLYGLHSDEIEDDDVEKICKKINNPSISLDKLSIFENENYDVLKFEIKHKELNRMNTLLKKEFPYTSNFPDYKAHATIGYLKAGTGKKYVGDLDKSESVEVKGKNVIYSKPKTDYIRYDI